MDLFRTRFTLQSSLPAEVIAGRIAALVSPPRGLVGTLRSWIAEAKADEPPLVGKIDGHSFRVRFARSVVRDGGPTTVIAGQIASDPNGSRLTITVVLEFYLIAMVVFHCLFLGGFLIAAIMHSAVLPLLIIPPWLLFATIFANSEFQPEVIAVRRLLSQALEVSCDA